MIDTKAVCWICKRKPATPSASISVKMYGEAKYGETSNYVVAKTRSVTFQTCEIIVPRCDSCKRSDITQHVAGIVTLLALGVAAYFAVTNWFGLTAPFSYLAAAVAAAIGWMAIMLVWVLVSPSTASEPTESNFYGSYPPIMQKIAQHWKLGDGPPGSIRT